MEEEKKRKKSSRKLKIVFQETGRRKRKERLEENAEVSRSIEEIRDEFIQELMHIIYGEKISYEELRSILEELVKEINELFDADYLAPVRRQKRDKWIDTSFRIKRRWNDGDEVLITDITLRDIVRLLEQKKKIIHLDETKMVQVINRLKDKGISITEITRNDPLLDTISEGMFLYIFHTKDLRACIIVGPEWKAYYQKKGFMI